MSTKNIAAGGPLTVGDLTDDHLGAYIEVGDPEGILYRLTLGRVDVVAAFTTLVTERGDERRAFSRLTPVKVITPPPVVQPDEPTILGQCIRIEGLPGYEAIMVDPSAGFPFLYRLDGSVWHTRNWEEIVEYAGDRQIIVSDPPRWPDETPEVPERIEVGEWPGDVSLRAYRWVDREGDSWTWRDREYGGLGWGITSISSYEIPLAGPWTRGERVE